MRRARLARVSRGSGGAHSFPRSDRQEGPAGSVRGRACLAKGLKQHGQRDARMCADGLAGTTASTSSGLTAHRAAVSRGFGQGTSASPLAGPTRTRRRGHGR
jgi:hypothetical protein